MESTDGTAAGNADTKVCPRCAETIKAAAKACRYCGADLQAYQATQEANTERMLFEGHPAVMCSAWQWIAVVLTLGIAYLFYATQSMALRYQISTQRIKIERGIITKVKDSIELFSVDHFDLVSPIGMRLVGYCILQLRSTDASYKNVTIYGVPDLEKLADTLRECALRERARRRILAVMST